DYHLGRRSGRYFLATLGQWLCDAEPLARPIAVTPPAAVANAPDNRPVSTPPLAGNDADYDAGSLA
ncbi:patatin family protein, partial [Klebsiella pneumoniae]